MTRKERIAEFNARLEARRKARESWVHPVGQLGNAYYQNKWWRARFADGFRITDKDHGWDNPVFVAKTLKEAKKWMYEHSKVPTMKQRHEAYIAKLIAKLEAEGYEVRKK